MNIDTCLYLGGIFWLYIIKTSADRPTIPILSKQMLPEWPQTQWNFQQKHHQDKLQLREQYKQIIDNYNKRILKFSR